MKKRVLAMMLSLAMCFSMTACGSTNNADKTKLMRRVLDIGAHGLLVPMVNTMDDARYVLDAVKFPPLGQRGMIREH